MKANPNKSQTLTISSQPDADKPNFGVSQPADEKAAELTRSSPPQENFGQPKRRAAAEKILAQARL